MNNEILILIEREEHWIARSSRGAQLVVEKNQPVSMLAEQLIHFVQSNQISRSAVVLLETQSAYFVELDSLRGKKFNETTLRYAAEAKLPVDAEHLVVDLLPKRDKAVGLPRAVALDASSLRDLIDALHQSKIAIRIITPESLIWLQYWSEQQKLSFPSVIVWKYDNNVEVCRFDENGQLLEWFMASEFSIPARLKHLENEGLETIAIYLSLESSESPTPLSDSFPLAKCLESRDVNRILPYVERLGTRKNRPWINLAKPPLVGGEMMSQNRHSLVRLAVAAGCFLVVLCGWLLVGIVKDQSVVAQADLELRSMYSQLHPGERIPASISRRLQSEHRESMARGKWRAGENETIEAIDVLRAMVSSLQNEWPFEIDEIRIDQTKVFVQCAFVYQEDAGKFVAALEQNGFDCEPPSITIRADNRFLATVLGVIEKAKTK
jgi:hypothetical protein